MNVVFLITTYKRRESCQRLVDGLQGLGDVVVVNDGCDYEITGCKQVFIKPHMGKDGYFVIVNRLWKNRGSYKYYFMLPDDFLICESQINEAIRIWESIEDPRKRCLNLLTDRVGVSCWTRMMPIDRGEIWQTGWVDMCFLCEASFFNAVPQIALRYGVKAGGSGVGAYISRHLMKFGFNMYQVKESLVTIQKEHYQSKMYEENNNSGHSLRRIQTRTVAYGNKKFGRTNR